MLSSTDIIYLGICNFAYLMKSSHSPKNKLKILLAYIKIVFTILTIGKLFHLNRESFLGFKTAGFDYANIHFLFDEIFYRNEYYFYTKKKDPVIIDCGANIGYATLFFKWIYPGSSVYSYEPDPQTFSLLSKNINENRLTDVMAFNAAISDQDGKIDFYIDPNRQGSLIMSTKSGRVSNDKITVDCVSLSSFIKNLPVEEIDLLKMDIEGSEQQVMEDLDKNGVFPKINKIIVEYHHRINNERSSFSKFLDIFERNGFEYQINARCNPVTSENIFQDFLVYLYKKN